jgi:hypothetical protein
MVHPLTIPGAAVPGRDIIRELLKVPGAATAYALHWKVLCWSYNPARPPCDAPTWGDVEGEMLSRSQEVLSHLCGRLAGLFARPNDLSKEDVARACLAISDWALQHGHGRTAVDFSKDAALAWPQNPRYACIAGGILKSIREVAEAEWWFRRAHRVAVWSRDREAQIRALIGWADAQGVRQGPEYAAHLYRRAITLAERDQLAELRADALTGLEQLRCNRTERTITA